MLADSTTTGQPSTPGITIDKAIFLRKFTENALQQVKEGNPEEYYKLVKVFSYSKQASSVTPEKYVEELTPWIPALSANISALNITYRELVGTVFNSDWITCSDERFVHRYATLVLQVLSAHPAWVPQAMTALVRWFTFGSRASDAAAAPIVHSHLHALVAEIYRTIPTCGTSLAAALVAACPFKTAKPNIQVLFMMNSLRCLEYAVGIRRPVLQLLLNHTIQIDVEVQVELDDLESENEDEEGGSADEAEEEEGIFEFEEEGAGSKDNVSGDPTTKILSEPESESESGSGSDPDSDSDSDSSSSSELGDADDLGKVKYSVKKIVGKLDAVMSTLFAWLDKHFQVDPLTGEMPESASQLFLIFLDLFSAIVLPTFKSRYTQFLLYFLCSKDPQYADVFLGTMMGNVGEPVRTLAQDKVSSVTKVSAASYLGSFVARAKFLSPSIVRSVIGVLVQWANAYLDWQEQTQKDSDATLQNGRSQKRSQRSYSQVLSGQGSSASQYSDFERHAVFYAVTQATLYMFCFRWRDLAEAHGGGPVVESELDNLRWCHEVEGIQRVVFSKLNPLRACASAVAQQFASVASQTNFMFCYAMLQKNRRNNTDSSAGSTASGIHGDGTSSIVISSSDMILRSELDTFFPFDPMALPISRQFIDNIYFEWQDVGAELSDSDRSNSDDAGDKDDEGDEDNEAGVIEQMVAMSISPVAPLSALPGKTFE
ncbi:RNA polymerase I-specific transcription initiation factor RRN3 [Coemansia spiralis]|nr:RNA polymerase I-specific transcription initiation factor RRN3 [Coemansia spiralis]